MLSDEMITNVDRAYRWNEETGLKGAFEKHVKFDAEIMTLSDSSDSSDTCTDEENILEAPTLRNTSALLHIVKGHIGAGVLMLPFAFKKAGFLYGTLALSLVVTIVLTGIHLLLEAQNYVMRRRSSEVPLSFEGVANAVLGKAGQFAVELAVCSLQLGVCAVFIGFVSTNLQPYFFGLSHWSVVGVIAIICVALGLLPDLEALWPLSLLGNIVSLTALCSVIVISVIQIVQSPPANPLKMHGSFEGFLAVISSGFYAFEGISLILPIGNALRPESKHRLRTTTFGGLSFVALMYYLVAGLGGVAFPDLTSGSITLYLRSRYEEGSAQDKYFEILNILVALAILATFPLQLTPAVQILDMKLRLSKHRSKVACRVASILGCTLLVLCVPDVSKLVDLLGAIASSTLAAMPFLFHARLTLYPDMQRGERCRMDGGRCLAFLVDGVIVAGFLALMIRGILGVFS